MSSKVQPLLLRTGLELVSGCGTICSKAYFICIASGKRMPIG